jgi:hypothetical protein
MSRDWKSVSHRSPCRICKSTKRCAATLDGRVAKCCYAIDGGVAREDEVGEYRLFFADGVSSAARRAHEPPPAAPLADIDTRHRVYSALLSACGLSDEHRDNLARRGLSALDIDARGYATLPASTRERTAIVAAARAQLGGEIPADVPGLHHGKLPDLDGVLIPVRDAQGRIAALKVRRDGARDPRYLWLSSAGTGGASPGSLAHAALGSAEMLDAAGGDGGERICRITEGPLKADVAAALSGVVTLAIPGASAIRTALPLLRALNPTVIRLAWDADARTNLHVAGGLEMAAHLLATEIPGACLELETWAVDGDHQPKGIDDALLNSAALVVHADQAAWSTLVEVLYGSGRDPRPETLARAGAEAGEQKQNAPDLFTRLAASPDLALDPAVIAECAALSPEDLTRVKEVLRAAGVPLRAFNAAIGEEREKANREQKRAAADLRVASLSAGGKKPIIRLGPDEDRVADEAVSALTRHASVFQRGGALVYVVADQSPLRGVIRPAGAARIAPLPLPTLREYLSGAAVWTTESEDGPKVAHVPSTCVQAVAARGQWQGLRALEGIVDCPMLRPDGSVIEEPGYDPATGVIYLPSRAFPRIPSAPTKADAQVAISRLADLFCDFPFRTPAHASAAIAALLTPLAVYAFPGPKPLFLFDANTAGAGKGKCVSIISEVVAGRPIAVMAPVEDDAEQRKRITALAIEGASLVLIDNIVGSLGGASMDAALTANEWSDRVLGSSTTVKLPLAITWFATGNNVALIGDMQRRVLHIRLESPEANPEDRVGFRHENVEAYARECRGELVQAALTVLRAYVLAGRPRDRLPSWGSFTGWSDLIRGAIVWCGLADPAETRQELRAEADFTASALRGLIAGWPDVAKRYGGHCTAAQALRELDRDDRDAFGQQRPVAYAALREALAELIASAPGKLPSTRQLGNTLRAYKGRVVLCENGSLRALSLVKSGENGAVWCVRESAPSNHIVSRGASVSHPESADSTESVSGYPMRAKSLFTQGAHMGAHVNNGTGHGPRAATESADSAESGPTPTVADFSTDFEPDDPDLGWGDPSAQDGGLNS